MSFPKLEKISFYFILHDLISQDFTGLDFTKLELSNHDRICTTPTNPVLTSLCKKDLDCIIILLTEAACKNVKVQSLYRS